MPLFVPSNCSALKFYFFFWVSIITRCSFEYCLTAICFSIFFFFLPLTSILAFIPPWLPVLKTSSPTPQVQRTRSYISILAYHWRGHWEFWRPSDITDGQHGQAPRERLGLIPIASQVTSLGLYLPRVFSIFKLSLKKYLSVITMHGIWRCLLVLWGKN